MGKGRIFPWLKVLMLIKPASARITILLFMYYNYSLDD
jgi:hypothetical protein